MPPLALLCAFPDYSAHPLSHPDKLTLADNQTKEEADSHFVELTKAYKAFAPSLFPLRAARTLTQRPSLTYSLTDDVSRRNYELYGHPDGKQEFSAGIALPAWIVESKNSPLVIGAYALLLGVVLPVLVVRLSPLVAAWGPGC